MTLPFDNALLEGEIEILGRLVDASNATLFGQAVLGPVIVPLIYKPRAGERPLWDFPSGSLADREVAAYKVSEALHWDLVPTTLLRDGPYGVGMVQQWIEIDETIDLATPLSTGHRDLQRMALFDAVINNTDRKFGHLLPTTDGRIKGCDHGITFHVDDKLRTVLWNWAGEPIPHSDLVDLSSFSKELESGELGDALIAHLAPEEIMNTMQRLTRLLVEERFPIPGTQWPAVPWPPF